MKNRMKGLRRGFTLLETVITVGIVVALLAISGIGVASYMRSMKQLELDGIAKEIFLAAQNNLSVAYAQNYAGAETAVSKADGEFKLLPVSDPTVTADPYDVYYFIVGDGDDYKQLDDTDASLLGQLLPMGSVDESVRRGGSYIIRYQKSSGRVLDVFYSEHDGQRFGHTLNEDDYVEFYKREDGSCGKVKIDKSGRRDYSENGAKRAVIGYYGAIDPLPYSDSELNPPVVTVYNGEKLYVNVTDTNPSTLRLILCVKGEQSGAEKIFEDLNAGSDENTRTFDDITSAATHFTKIFGSGFIPGENLIIHAEIYDDAEGLMAESAYVKTNSLFASYDAGIHMAEIAAIRHLENLAPEISGRSLSTLPLEIALQTTDLSWKSFSGQPNTYFAGDTICGPLGVPMALKGQYAPVNIGVEDAVVYNGGMHEIADIETGDWSDWSTSYPREDFLAGVFGGLENCTVANLKIVNAKISGTASGALCGVAKDCTFCGILAYNSVSDDTEYEIFGSEYAGGLIGCLSASSKSASKVDGCAAAVYVRADAGTLGVAGGFVGAVTDSAITNSYAGGHTNSAKYGKITDKTKPGHLNVIGNKTAGGFAGIAENTEFSYSYTTASAGARTATAGFIAESRTGNTVKNCYVTGLVMTFATPSSANAFFVGEQPEFEGENYYLIGVSTGVVTPSGIANLTGYSGRDVREGADKFILPETKRQSVHAYDSMLRVTFMGKYYFPTVAQLHEGETPAYTSVPGITDTHFGDWEIPMNGLPLTVYNLDDLFIELGTDLLSADGVTLTSGSLSATLAIRGQTSKKITMYCLEIYTTTVDGKTVFDPTKPPEIKKIRNVDDTTLHSTDHDWEDPSGTQTLPKITVSEKGNLIDIMLDSITTEGQHFRDIFPAMTPGESLEVYFINGKSAPGDDISSYLEATANSLFSDYSVPENGTASIQNVRHLQNLDPAISGVGDLITKAELYAECIDFEGTDLCFHEGGADNYDTVYALNGTELNTEKSFYSIYNKNLAEFDGKTHTLKNFTFASDTDLSAGYMGNAGLFRYVDREFTVKNLRLQDCTAVSTSDHHAGMVIAQSNYCTVSLDTVLADSSSTTASVKATGSGAAGGLIGLAGGVTNLTIENSAASVCVSSESGAAGGLVGNHNSGTITITKSYAGGHTVDGKYVTDAADKYNVYSAGGNAGGLVGIATGTSLEIEKSFSAASAASGTSAAGGIVGAVYCSEGAKFDYVYAIAPVRNVRSSTNPYSSSGAVVGQSGAAVQDTNTYYLPEIYTGAGSDVTVMTCGISGSFTEDPGYAYYQKDGTTTGGIAAKSNFKTMQIRTYPFDSTLEINKHDSTFEYPFSIWTSFEFDGAIDSVTGYTFGTYYGDWEPVITLDTIPHNITFRYKNPVTNEYVSLADKTLGTQEIHELEENRVLVPYVEPYSGWAITGWKLTYTGKDNVTATTTLTTDTGYLTLSEALCYDNITAEAVYEGVPKADDKCTLAFFYDPTDPTGGNYATKGIGVFEQIGKTETYAKNTDLSTVESPVRVIEGYNFLGWYDSPDFKGTRYDLEDDSSGTIVELDRDLVLYAKYEKIEFYNITIDFMYRLTDDTTKYEHLQSVPRYRVDDQPQYRIQCVKGKSFIDDVKLPVVTNFQNPVLTDYEDHDEDFLEACKMYISSDKETLHIESLVKTDENGENETRDINLIVVYEIVDASELKLMPYTIQYVLEDSDPTNGSYEEGSEFRYDPYAGNSATGTGSIYFQAPVGTMINVRPKTEGTVPGTSLILEGFDVDEIEKLTISENPADNVVHVKYKRKEFILTYESLGGTYVYPQTVVYGTPLSAKKPNGEMQRQGYKFDTSKGFDGWTILDYGVNFQDNTSIATAYRWTGTMPAGNIVAWANWESKPVDFRVMYWYENSDSDNPYDAANYSYMGSLSDKKFSGTEISSDDYKGYPGMSANGHTTHTASCYPGTGDEIETKTTKVTNYTYSFNRNGTKNITLNADGTKWVYNKNEYDRDGLRIKYNNQWYNVTENKTETTETTYFNGNKEITIANIGSAKTGYVSTWTYKDGTPGSGKCIYVDGAWHFYTGTTDSGKTASCKAPTYEWIDNNNFTFNDQFTETKTVSSDGTTVLNVYFTRNTYTLMFYSDKKTTCMVEEHTHTDACYAYYCPGVHFHTDACLTCDKVEHTHTVECCSLTEHTHDSSCCSIEEHKHTAACCSVPEHTHNSTPGLCCSLTVHPKHDADCCELEEHAHSVNNRCYTIADKSSGTNISLQGYILQQNASKYKGELKKGTNGKTYYSNGNNWYEATLTCTKSEHTHGNGCTCSTPLHTHGKNCNTDACPNNGKTHTHGDGKCEYTKCGYTYEHTHGTGCNTADCPVGYEHTHGTGCNTAACTVGYAHTHTKAQGCFDGCSYPDHVHDDHCIKYLVCDKAEHTHGTDCSKNLNGTKYLAGIIQAKYNEDIHEYFPIKNSDVDTWDDANGYAYNDNSKKDALYSAYISAIDRMPAMPSGMTVGYFTNYAFSGSNTFYVYYYLETLPDEAYDIKTTLDGTAKYFKQYKTITFKGSSSVSLTRDEEFHVIEGFERYAYQIGDRGSVKADSASKTSYGVADNSDSSKPKFYFFYTRNTSVLEYYVESSTPVSTNKTIYYEEPLAAYELDGTTLDNPYGPDYTFDGWYADPGFSNEIDFSKTTMPLGKLAVYGRWAPPTYSVKFDADYVSDAGSSAASYKASVTKKSEGVTVKYDPTDAGNRSFIVEKNGTISDYITNEKGFILDSYTPEKSGYTFEGWYYDRNSTKETIEKEPFISSIAITEDITIYADWKLIENAGTLRDVTIFYYDALKNGPIRKEDVIKDTYSVGERPSFTAPDIYGYYPVTMVQYLTVQNATGGSANSITFFYMPIAEWNYRTEYYVSYRNYETDTDDVFTAGTFSDGTSSYLICSTDGIPAYDQYVNVEFKFPEGYEDGYRLVKYDSNGSIVKTTNTIAILNKRDGDDSMTEEEKKMLNVVKFYIEPDPGKFLITDRITTYNGESQVLRQEDVTASSVFAFPNRAYDVEYDVDLPGLIDEEPEKRTLTTHYYASVTAGYAIDGGAKAFIANEYRYFLSDRRSIDDPSVTDTERKLIDAGAYRMNGYIVLSVTGIAENETEPATRTFLEWKNVNYDLNLRIQPRPVKITSTTASQPYDPKNPLVRSNLTGAEDTWDIKIEGPNDGKPAFIEPDGAKFYFTADAFRLEKGTTDNSFTYELLDGTKKWNYLITIVFGKLTVN